MPYINSKDERREYLQQGNPAISAGELNYQIFWFVKHYEENGLHPLTKKQIIKSFVDAFLGHNPNYQRWNDMTGCLIRCYKEIKRRLDKDEKILLDIMESYDGDINIYEDKKIMSNGDVL